MSLYSLSRIVVALALLRLLGGCAAPPPAAPTVHDQSAGSRIVALAQNPAAEQQSTLDAPPAMTLVFQVDVYQLSFPSGTYSLNEEFWKHIDEQCVDVTTYDLLYKNGLRVGVAPMSELKSFEHYMQGVVPAQRLNVRATEVRNIEIEARKDLPEETIFSFDTTSATPPGRSYDRCDNIINLSFTPAPRKQGQLRVTLCPMVRSHRKHLEFSLTNEVREIEYVSPEYLYDLNIRADVPRDGFLILAPSEFAAARATSVGRAFMTREEPTQRTEQVLLVIPHPFRVPDDQATRVR